MNKLKKMLVVLVSSVITTESILGADTLYQRFSSYILDEVVPWIYVIGFVGVAVSILGGLKARSDQSENIIIWVRGVGISLLVLLTAAFIEKGLLEPITTINF